MNFVKLLRSSALYSTHELAVAALQAKLAALTDGEVAICSYGEDWASAKSIFGIAREKDGKHSYTILDNDAASQEIIDAIAALDASQSGTSVDGHVTVNVVETDGKITKVGVATNDIASAQALADEITRATDAEADLLEKIEEVEGNAAKYKVVALTAEEIALLPDGANVKEAFKVIAYTGEWETATDKTQVGETIKIYKDSSLKSATFVTEKPGEEEGTVVEGNFLKLVYILADGSESTVYVDMSTIITEAEVKNGIAVDASDNKLYVKLDATSDSFLTVGADGVKLSGVQDAIDTEIARATAAEEANATAIENLEAEVIKNEKVTAESIIKVVNAAGVIDGEGNIGYHKVEDANYIKDAVSIQGATEILDAKLKEVADEVSELGGDALKKVNGSNAITVSDKDAAKEQTISLKLDNATDNALSITENGLFLSNIWDCGEY